LKWSCGIVISLLCACFASSSLTSDAGPARGVSLQERQALIALYEATDGSHWKNHEGWLGPAGTECSWHGVECEPSHKEPATLMGLSLAQSNLVGYIPKEIRELRNLEWLDVSENHLTGSIPETLGELTKLTQFNVYGNHFSGRLPDSLVQRWLARSLWVVAEAPLLTDVSEIDFESDPSALLCGRRRMILRSDGSAVLSTVRCRNATRHDRRTFCEVKQKDAGWSSFATLAWLLEKNGFYALRPEYSTNITDSVFESTRVTRGGKTFEVVNYAGGGPFELWVIERAIEGVALSTLWEKTKIERSCPRWSDASKTPSTR
jgi:Leucine Rich Repeat (LRR) protein